MKKPREGDYDVEINEDDVEVTFKPTQSRYTFAFLADHRSLNAAHFKL
jgi:hypothetical protein